MDFHCSHCRNCKHISHNRFHGSRLNTLIIFFQNFLRETKIWQVYKRENLAKFYQLPDTDMLLILPTICTSKQDGYALRLKEHYRDLIMGLQWPGHSDQKDDSNNIFKWLSKVSSPPVCHFHACLMYFLFI